MTFLPDAIMLGQFPLALGAFMGVLGGVLAYLAAGWSARRSGGDANAAQDMVLNLLVGGVAGAKLVYVALDPGGYVANPMTLFIFPYGPLALPAGVVGGLLLAAWGLRGRTDWLKLLDWIAVPLTLGLTLAAVGWKGPGAWAFAPLLAASALASAAITRRAGAPGHAAAQTLILASLALVLADIARPATGLVAGITLLQLTCALAATAAWLWTRPRT